MPILIEGAGLAGSPRQLRIEVEIYAINDRPCLSLVEVQSGELYECFTSNVPTEDLRDDEVVVCMWRLPMSTVCALLDSDCFAPVRTLGVANTRGAVWRITSPELQQAVRSQQAIQPA